MILIIFDNHYYRDIMMGRGLFGIDSSIREQHPLSRSKLFLQDFLVCIWKTFLYQCSHRCAGSCSKAMQPGKLTLMECVLLYFVQVYIMKKLTVIHKAYPIHMPTSSGNPKDFIHQCLSVIILLVSINIWSSDFMMKNINMQ